MRKIAILFISAVTLAILLSQTHTGRAASSHEMTKQDVDRDMKELSNWGRWGKEDQLGSWNLVTAAKRKQAYGEVREGFTVSLSHDYQTERALDNATPFVQRMGPTGPNNRGQFVVDSYSWPAYHGWVHTHLDALCHMSDGGLMFNGFSRDEVDQTGAHKLSIGNLKGGIVSRGVLVDIARLKGVPLARTGNSRLPRRSRCLGEDGSRENREGRYCHWTLGAQSREGSVAARRPCRRISRILRTMAQGS
jgi:hypothetical protein